MQIRNEGILGVSGFCVLLGLHTGQGNNQTEWRMESGFFLEAVNNYHFLTTSCIISGAEFCVNAAWREKYWVFPRVHVPWAPGTSWFFHHMVKASWRRESQAQFCLSVLHSASASSSFQDFGGTDPLCSFEEKNQEFSSYLAVVIHVEMWPEFKSTY